MGGPSFYLPSPVPKSRLSISMHANCMDGYKTIRKWTPPPLANWIVEKIALPIFHKLHRFVVHGFFYFQRIVMFFEIETEVHSAGLQVRSTIKKIVGVRSTIKK